MKVIKIVFVQFVSLGLFLACSNDDPEPGCFQEQNRRIVATITNINGTFAQECSDSFTIRPDEVIENNPVGSFFPCNLTDDFQVDGAQVVFSGYIYESFDNEDICADFFEIIDIRFRNQ